MPKATSPAQRSSPRSRAEARISNQQHHPRRRLHRNPAREIRRRDLRHHRGTLQQGGCRDDRGGRWPPTPRAGAQSHRRQENRSTSTSQSPARSRMPSKSTGSPKRPACRSSPRHRCASPQATQAVRSGSIGKVTYAQTTSPASIDPHHPDLFWYGVHGCESLFTVMGTGCVGQTRHDRRWHDRGHRHLGGRPHRGLPRRQGLQRHRQGRKRARPRSATSTATSHSSPR